MMKRSLSRTTIVAALVAAMAGCGDKPEAEVLATAAASLARQDPGAAVVELKALLDRQPQSGAARHLLGKALLAQGNATAADIELAKAEELRHDPNLVAPDRARALLVAGQPAKALEQYRQTRLSDAGAEAELKVTLATAAAATGQAALAEGLLAEAGRLGSELPRAVMLRARLDVAAGRPEAALSRLDSLTATPSPETADAWALKAEIRQSSLKDVDAAMAAYRQALQADGTHVAAHRGIVLLLLAGGDIAGATTQLEALERAKPNAAAAKVLHAMLALARKDYAGVRNQVQPLLNASPNNPVLLELAGTAEFHLNALDKAESLLKTALVRAPQQDMARQVLAQVYLRRGQADRVLETLEPYLKAGTMPVHLAAMAGQAHLLNGEPARAQQLFAAAPGDDRSQVGLAVARLSQGGGAAALADLEGQARRSPAVTADVALIAHHMRQQDWTRALSAIDALARKQPDGPAAHLLRGQVLSARKDFAGARASYEAALKVDARLLPALQGLAGLDILDGKPERARQRLSPLVAERPADASAQLALVQLMDRIGSPPDEVIEQTRSAVTANPDSVHLRLHLINGLLRSGQFALAKTAAADALATVPGNPELLHAQGRVSLAAGDHQQAISAFNELTQRLPKSPQLQLDLASARVGLGDLAAAERHLRRALELAPDMAAAQQALVATLLRNARHDAALAVARQAQRRQPTRAAGHLLEGDVEFQRQGWDAAIAAYRQGLRIEPTAGPAIRVHTALMAARRADEAARFAKSWQAEHPTQVDFIAYLADQHALRGDLGGAEAAYRQVLQVRPQHAGALNNLAWLLARQGKPGALALAERARAAAPYDPTVQDTLALALAAEGQVKRALDSQTQLVARYPNHPDYRLHLAELLVRHGDKRKARDELDVLERLGERYPRQPEVAALRGRL